MPVEGAEGRLSDRCIANVIFDDAEGPSVQSLVVVSSREKNQSERMERHSKAQDGENEFISDGNLFVRGYHAALLPQINQRAWIQPGKKPRRVSRLDIESRSTQEDASKHLHVQEEVHRTSDFHDCRNRR